MERGSIFCSQIVARSDRHESFCVNFCCGKFRTMCFAAFIIAVSRHDVIKHSILQQLGFECPSGFCQCSSSFSKVRRPFSRKCAFRLGFPSLDIARFSADPLSFSFSALLRFSLAACFSRSYLTFRCKGTPRPRAPAQAKETSARSLRQCLHTDLGRLDRRHVRR